MPVAAPRSISPCAVQNPRSSPMADEVVYVVDDDDALRDSLSFLLSSVGISAQTFDSAAAFLTALPRNGRGCVITDVRMPGMSGIDLLRELKNKSLPLPVIVITGHGDV